MYVIIKDQVPRIHLSEKLHGVVCYFYQFLIIMHFSCHEITLTKKSPGKLQKESAVSVIPKLYYFRCFECLTNSHFSISVGCAIVLLLQNPDLLPNASQRLAAVTVLHQMYKGEPMSACPFAGVFVHLLVSEQFLMIFQLCQTQLSIGGRSSPLIGMRCIQLQFIFVYCQIFLYFCFFCRFHLHHFLLL